VVARALLDHKMLSRSRIAEVMHAEMRRRLIENFGGDVEKAESLLSAGASLRAKRRAMSPEQRRTHDAYWTQRQREERARIRVGVERVLRGARKTRDAI